MFNTHGPVFISITQWLKKHLRRARCMHQWNLGIEDVTVTDFYVAAVTVWTWNIKELIAIKLSGVAPSFSACNFLQEKNALCSGLLPNAHINLPHFQNLHSNCCYIFRNRVFLFLFLARKTKCNWKTSSNVQRRKYHPNHIAKEWALCLANLPDDIYYLMILSSKVSLFKMYEMQYAFCCFF